MIVALSWIGEHGIKRNIVVRPCLIRASPTIGHSTGAEDIVEPDDRVNMAGDTTVETGLPGFCDYYVIGQFHLVMGSIGKDARTVCGGVVVGNRVIDEYRPTDAGAGNYPVDTSAVRRLIAGDDILDDQRTRIIHRVDAASLTSQDIIPLNDIPFDDRGCSSPRDVDAASTPIIHVVGDHLVQHLR